MINNQISSNDIFSAKAKKTKKSHSSSSHSTDTEPEVEVENKVKIIQTIDINTANQNQQKCSTSNKKEKNVFKSFINDLPSFEYDQNQIRKNQLKKKQMEKNKENIPINLMDTNNNRFLNYFEAFLYIAEHCLKNDQKFTRDNCKKYLKQCYIIDFAHDNFIPISTNLSQQQFNKYFRLSQRELKYI